MTADATAPLVFKGQLCLSSDGVTYTDVSDETTHASLSFAKDTVAVPATAGQPKTSRGGGTKPPVFNLGYLSTDGTTGTILPMLWTAAGTATKTLFYKLLMRDGGESSTNPMWAGSFIVSGAMLGADAEALSTDTQQFPCTDLPTITES